MLLRLSDSLQCRRGLNVRDWTLFPNNIMWNLNYYVINRSMIQVVFVSNWFYRVKYHRGPLIMSTP